MKPKKSRLPGVVYLITVLTWLFSLMYVPKQLIDLENISDTMASIEANRLLFAYGIIGGFLCYIAFLILPLVLYPYLKNDCHHLANIMVGLVLVAVPISCLAVVDKIDILGFLDDPDMQAEKLEMLITL